LLNQCIVTQHRNLRQQCNLRVFTDVEPDAGAIPRILRAQWEAFPTERDRLRNDPTLLGMLS
jgi:hypothetical protein